MHTVSLTHSVCGWLTFLLALLGVDGKLDNRAPSTRGALQHQVPPSQTNDLQQEKSTVRLCHLGELGLPVWFGAFVSVAPGDLEVPATASEKGEQVKLGVASAGGWLRHEHHGNQQAFHQPTARRV